MDDLNNKQIVLLTMLVSFVVSIATGIITVAMLQEAPPVLTQTVNRVVERTIERVVTGTSTPEKQTTQPVTSVTKEVTIYAKEDDLIVSAVEKNQSRIALIYVSGQATDTPPLAEGFIVSRDGVLVADQKSISNETGLRESYIVTIGENSYRATPMKSEVISKSPLALLKISDVGPGETFDAVTFGRQGDPKIAQTVIVLGGGDGLGVFKGTLAKFHYAKTESTTTPPYVSDIETAPKIPEDNIGALVVNLDAQAVGIVVNSADSTHLVIFPSSRILDLVTAVSDDAAHPVTATDAPKTQGSAS